MTVRTFKKIQFSDSKINLLQDYIADAFDSIMRNPLLGGQLLSQITLRAGNNDISHGLGRNYVSWCWMNPSAFVTMAYGTSPDSAKYVRIVASAPCTADIYVF